MTEKNGGHLGKAEDAIDFAMGIDDHFDMRAFLKDWRNGSLCPDDDADYFDWLAARRRKYLLDEFEERKPSNG
jgi:hypothetical protein